MIKKLLIHFSRLILKILPLHYFPRINRLLFILMGNKIGKNVTIFSSTKILGLLKVEVDDNTFIGHDCLFIGGESNITIGQNCDISSRVSFVTGSHLIGNIDRRAGIGISKDIIIGNGVWIGYAVVILGGIKIGDGSIIAAGSLVNKDIESNSLYGGVPAKLIKRL